MAGKRRVGKGKQRGRKFCLFRFRLGLSLSLRSIIDVTASGKALKSKKKKWIGPVLSRLLGESAHCWMFLNTSHGQEVSRQQERESPDQDVEA